MIRDKGGAWVEYSIAFVDQIREVLAAIHLRDYFPIVPRHLFLDACTVGTLSKIGLGIVSPGTAGSFIMIRDEGRAWVDYFILFLLFLLYFLFLL